MRGPVSPRRCNVIGCSCCLLSLYSAASRDEINGASKCKQSLYDYDTPAAQAFTNKQTIDTTFRLYLSEEGELEAKGSLTICAGIHVVTHKKNNLNEREKKKS